MYHSVYQTAQLQSCNDHIFCDRENIEATYSPDELNPLPGPQRWNIKNQGTYNASAVIKGTKDISEWNEYYKEYLKKDFYYRNIVEKKKLLKQGVITTNDFQDDGVEKYVIEGINDDENERQSKNRKIEQSNLDHWREHSAKLAQKCRTKRIQEETEQYEREKKNKILQNTQ